MKPSRILPLAAVLLACNAFAGFYATAAFAAVMSAGEASQHEEPVVAAPRTAAADYPGKPAPILLSPFARAIAAPDSQGPALGPLTPPDTETDAQRSLRRAAEATAKVAGIFADPDCRPGNPVTLVGCNEYPPEDRR
jgi:hypothetical protein